MKEGSEIIFNCETNVEGAKAKWLKNEETIFESSKYMMAQRDNVFSLRIRDAHKADEASYSISLTNHRGEQARSSASAKVTGKQLHLHLGSLSRSHSMFTPSARALWFIAEGDTSSLLLGPCQQRVIEKPPPPVPPVFSCSPCSSRSSCSSRFSCSSCSYLFLFPPVLLVPPGFFCSSISCRSPCSSFCFLLVLLFQAALTYLCVSTEERLRFLEPIDDIETQEKKTISFTCKVNRPEVSVKWMKAGQELTLSKRIVSRADGLGHTLTIKDCVMEDEGEYVAVVGEDRCAAELIISEAPTDFTAQVKDQTITEFEDADFTCKLSKEKAAVKWYKDGREIREGSR